MSGRWLRSFGLIAILTSAALVLASCGGQVKADQPPKIKFGVDTCSRCHMIISEEKYAAGLVAADGQEWTFDDTGEMFLTIKDEGLKDRRAWVHDFDSAKWIDATTAFFVDSHDIMTPMGMGVVAFEQREAADKLAAEKGGTVRDWSTMLVEWEMHGHH